MLLTLVFRVGLTVAVSLNVVGQRGHCSTHFGEPGRGLHEAVEAQIGHVELA
ncbi:hypothetical protein [Sorangium sp. So ce1182]|uniref:hypothetical protein n=1 Tax=Sorangium sp. So ce1182 TaxID=3133334 RepID=UPI003F5E0AF4